MQYRELIVKTIKENYNQAQLKKINKLLKSRNIISKEENLITLSENTVIISGEDLKEDIIQALNQREQDTIKVIEELEYYYGCKYSVYYKVDENFSSKIEHLINRGVLIPHESKENDDVVTSFKNPYTLKPSYFKINDDLHAFKFSLELIGFQGRENPIKINVKYPVIVYFFEKYNIIEIRLDSLKGFLKMGDELFYTRTMEQIASWISIYCSKTKVVNLSPVIDYISKKGNPDVNVAAQSMNHITGSKTILDTGTDDNSVLPILGELRNLIQDNQSLFNSCNVGIQINKVLIDFIEEIEESSDFPWVSLRWSSISGKSNIARVKFSFGYKKSPLDILQYYDASKTGMEKMNYVTQYIIDHQIEYEAERNQPEEAGKII